MPLTDADARHIGAIRVSGELLRDNFFTPSPAGQVFRVTSGIPADARFVRWYLDDMRNQLVCIYEHPSFPLTRPGDLLTFIDSPEFMSINIPESMCEPCNPEGERMFRILEEIQHPMGTLKMPSEPFSDAALNEIVDALQKSKTGKVLILPNAVTAMNYIRNQRGLPSVLDMDGPIIVNAEE